MHSIKMGRKCMVPECLSEEGRHEDRGVTFHKIPLHSDIRWKWMSLCHIPEDKHMIKVVHVCSRHFLKADFCRFKGKKYMLKQGVLPSVFPWSKLKKEVSAPTDETSNTDKEIIDEPLGLTILKQDPIEFNSENVNFEETFAMADLKIEIKDEPTVLLEETVEIKTEPSLHSPSDSLVMLPPHCDPVKKPEPVQKSSTIIEQREKSIQTSSGILNFTINTRLEALDFNQMWFPARIIEVDYEENEVLIHFEKYSSKYDEWINMNSSRLRPLQPPVKKTTASDAFTVGEKCMASWSDSRKFPASVTRVVDKDTYEVLFNDGFLKVLKGHRMAKADGKPVGSAPLFDPAEGTKQDRREKKRKINVAQLFRKRARVDHSEESTAVSGAAATSTASTTVSAATTPGAAEEGIASPVEEPELWIPRWENGRPIGVDSVIETNDGIRKSVIVADPRLPQNWQKHLTQRIHGASAGKWDTVLVSPEGRRFRTRSEIKSFLEENPQLNYTDGMFDFSLHKRARVNRRPTHVIEPPTVPERSIPEPAPEEENPNSLKILLVDDVYKCPIEGCGKNFRRENLAQMHVKHYHPKYTKYLDSTPNVADLAYARTVGESLDKSPERISRAAPVRQTQKNITPKSSTPKVVQSPVEPETKVFQQPMDSHASQLQKTKDSEILKLLNSKPPDDSVPKYPPGLPPSMYPNFQLSELLNNTEGIPNRENLNLKSLSASTTRPTGIKTLLPVIRSSDKKESETEKSLMDTETWPKTPTIKTHSIKQTLKRKRQTSENVEVLKSRDSLEATTSTMMKQDLPQQIESASNYIVEGGQVIKIVRMKQEEIINCTCGFTEEDGLMIQCELCLCWQHAYCNNIERENQVPEKYICYICQNPMRQRSSRKYFHDQDWLKNGTLPVGNYHCKDNEALKKRFEKLKKSHDLTGGLLELKDFMNSLKVKTKIAEAKNHPKLYLWSKLWEKHSLPEKIQPKRETKLRPSIAESQLSKNDLDLLHNKNESQNDSMLLSILKSAKDQQKFKEELDLNTLINNNLEQLPIAVPIIPQPEAAIESADCKLNLLDHIAHCQTLVEERLNDFEAQVDALEGVNSNSEEDFTRTCQTVQMLLRDLSTLKELSHSPSF